MPVQIHGNTYQTVAERVAQMRSVNPDWTIKTKVLVCNEFRVMIRASLYDGGFKLIATGHAEEERGSDHMTETSAVEICETSAVGRMLAFAEWQGSETEFDPQVASADEVGHAIRMGEKKLYGEYMKKVHEHWDSIVAIKQFLLEGNMGAAKEAYEELGRDDMVTLWKAPTKGGIFTTEERRLMKEGASAEPQEV